jgi:hypothetical protein
MPGRIVGVFTTGLIKTTAEAFFEKSRAAG